MTGDETAGDAQAGEPARFRVRRTVRRDRAAGEDGNERVASRDETDEGWGDAPARRDADWYERQRPPHHE